MLARKWQFQTLYLKIVRHNESCAEEEKHLDVEELEHC